MEGLCESSVGLSMPRLLCVLKVDAVEGTVASTGVNERFIGVILLPIVGNGAEHVVALMAAVQNRVQTVAAFHGYRFFAPVPETEAKCTWHLRCGMWRLMQENVASNEKFLLEAPLPFAVW